MARAYYTIGATKTAGIPKISFLIRLSDVTGTAQHRIYKEGDIPPAFTNMGNDPFSPSYKLSTKTVALNNDVYIIEYKDSARQRVIGKVHIGSLNNACVTLVEAQSYSYAVQIVGAPISTVKKASIDNGASYATLSSFGSYSFSNSHITSLGLTDNIIGVKLRTTTCGDVTGISNFYIGEWSFNPMVVTGVATNITSNGLSDGSIALTITGGSGNRIYKWDDGYPQPEFGSRSIFAQVNLGGNTSLTFTDSLSLVIPAGTYVQLSGGAHDGIYRTIGNQIVDYAVTIDLPYNAANNFAGTTLIRYFYPTTQNRTGLSEGSYHVTVTDLTTGEIVELDFVITEPEIVSNGGSFLEIPKMNSITWVVDEEISQCDNPQGLDNVLLCHQEHEGFDQSNYFQPFNICDAPVTQFNSDYSTFDIELRKYANDELVKTFSFELKEQNIGVLEDYTITIRNHTITNQSRVYFTIGALPIPLNIGDPFQIVNNANGYNGSYSIIDIINDATLGYQYLVINKTFTGPGLYEPGTGRFEASTADFNVFESPHLFNDVAEGEYYMYMKAFDSSNSLNFKTATSEPLDIRNTHPGTNQLKYRNIDNAFDMTWTTGYQAAIRVPSHFGHRRSPGGERATNRNSDYKLVKVSAKKTRVLLFQVWSLPPYMHEKLSTAFDCDSYTINNIECQTSEGYGEPEYKDRFLLADSSIKLEAKWYDRYNSDDLGSVADGGFILTETGFLKR